MNLSADTVAERLTLAPLSSSELALAANVSPSTGLRALRALERDGRVVRMGRTRGARYGLRRVVDSIGSEWPVFQIDANGAARQLGKVHAIERNSYYLADAPGRLRGVFEGVPYFLQDARPAGFLGRAVPRMFADLELPERVADWTDEHFLVYLTRRSTDASGSLIVGEESMDRYLAGLQQPPLVSERERPTEFSRFALAAMAGTPPGSSAQGEHPKFTVWIGNTERRTAALVKFSPPYSTAVGRRWADLLTSEHVAHEVLEENGLPACRSEILDTSERVFLQCERFDRLGNVGRRGVASLLAVDSWLYGRLDSWTAAAERLQRDRLLSAMAADRILLLDAFGALIANTDRHFGNITFFDDYEGSLDPAPVYDMLPMLFAPVNDQLVPRTFEAPSPRAAWLSVWSRARSMAQAYWERLAADERLSPEFRQLCEECLAAVRATPALQ